MAKYQTKVNLPIRIPTNSPQLLSEPWFSSKLKLVYNKLLSSMLELLRITVIYNTRFASNKLQNNLSANMTFCHPRGIQLMFIYFSH